MKPQSEIALYKQALKELKERTVNAENKVENLENALRAVNVKICLTRTIPNAIKNDLLKLCRI